MFICILDLVVPSVFFIYKRSTDCCLLALNLHSSGHSLLVHSFPMKSWKVLAHDAFDTFATRLPCLWCRWRRLLWHKKWQHPRSCVHDFQTIFATFNKQDAKLSEILLCVFFYFLKYIFYIIYSIPKACGASLVQFLVKYLQSEQPTCPLMVSQRIHSLQKKIIPSHLFHLGRETFLFCVSDTLTIRICVNFCSF